MPTRGERHSAGPPRRGPQWVRDAGIGDDRPLARDRGVASPVSAQASELGPRLAPGLPPPAARWAGFAKYNFVGGHNDAELVPVEELIAAATAVLRREGRTLATYGLESGPQGYLPLRAFLAGKLESHAGIACGADDMLITSGSLQALDLVNALLLAPGDTVLVEEATYGGALSRFARLGVTAHGVALDEQGLRLDALGAALADLERRGVRPKYLYTIP